MNAKQCQQIILSFVRGLNKPKQPITQSWTPEDAEMWEDYLSRKELTEDFKEN